MIEILDDLLLGEHEVTFTTSRSSGPGGQNVNKVESRVTLRFDLEASDSLSEERRDRIRQRLANRIGRDGVLSVSSQKHRTQGANRAAVVARFAELVAEALREETPRKATRVSRSAKRVRLQDKRKRSGVKKRRQRPDMDD